MDRLWMIIFCVLAASLVSGYRVIKPHSFECPRVGTFPDPTDCHNFYKCDGSLVPKLGTCINGTGTYDSDSQMCRVTSCSGPPEQLSTSAPAFTCTTVGVFADPTNCHNYYTCGETLQPFHGSCIKGNGTFDPVNRVCKAESCSDPVATTTTAAPVTPSNIAFKCTAEGYFADPKDCHSYYACGSSLKAVRGTCMGGGGHFDRDTEGCVIGSC
ncbi:uncharacterized protein LOC110830111 isoform X2 [Zootermopsis nevadensis]|uniref:uncharacterized protein LOC110830111 isoform X2 n=1 Tax=Zootermopsis nevadensis TaxID=136037 RepID=UPI000B8EA176|nr:uncharacterized protein LOC110830111 isoform X2 [Zootermopsis nevadensis]